MMSSDANADRLLEDDSSIYDFTLLRKYRPTLENIRDLIGATKVISVPNEDVEPAQRVGKSKKKKKASQQRLGLPEEGTSGQKEVSRGRSVSVQPQILYSQTVPTDSRVRRMVMPMKKLNTLKQESKNHESSYIEGSRSKDVQQIRQLSFESLNTAQTMQTVPTVPEETKTEFSFVKETANGASAAIFKSYRNGGLKSVAVKRIRGKIFKDHEAELTQMLDREKQALRELSSCPYITKFYEYVQYRPLDEHWMVMEFCDGGSAIDLLRSKLPLNQIAAIVGATLRAIEFIHDRGYIHGDIKCANILISSPGVVKVCDFGLASKVKNVKAPDFHALGTVDYMAPEVMRKSIALDEDDPYAESYKYDRKIDIWAVGIVVLELLIGHPPMHHYRRLDEENFSIYIANIPEVKNRSTGLFELFYPPKEIQNFVEGSFRIANQTPPRRDLQKLIDRFPELRAPAIDNKIEDLFHNLSYFKTKPTPKNPKDLHHFNMKKVVGLDSASRMYGFGKCLSFVSQCLLNKVSWRPEAKDIGLHPFVRNQYKEYIDLEPHIDQILQANQSRKARNGLWKHYKTSATVHQINRILQAKEKKLREKLMSRRK